jgi:hypothetical protein
MGLSSLIGHGETGAEDLLAIFDFLQSSLGAYKVVWVGRTN